MSYVLTYIHHIHPAWVVKHPGQLLSVSVSKLQSAEAQP